MNNTTIELIDERIELLVQWREIEDDHWVACHLV